MTLWTYLGHRILGGVLGVTGFIITIAGFASGSTIFGILGIIMMVAAAYFFKTQH